MGGLSSKNQADGPDLNIDLENAKPTPDEAGTYAHVLNLLRPTVRILATLREYQGCNEYIRQAISNPCPETEEAAWDAVCPAVERLREFYEYAAALEDAVPLLLTELVKTGGDNSEQDVHPDSESAAVYRSLERQPALTRLFADIMDFIFEFDDLKMANPAIQNDFSYYRRTLNRLKMSSQMAMRTPVVNDELANRMSLFYAHHTPMVKTVIDVTSNFVSSRPDGFRVADVLAGLAGVCYHTVAKQRLTHPDAVCFCLRVQVACTVLYDHIHPAGAFVRTAPVNIRNIVRVCNEHAPQQPSLVNALRYNTRHLNDETTPKALRQLLA
ncbi:hypothetical protein BDF19DRAFT_455363 [Syncephalis fuscata]|nr:hypothetical protein BDF19DRAFT_455363 [Syncephalis fuscata]